MTDFCFQNIIENNDCIQKHMFKCVENNLCSVDRYTCQRLIQFSRVKNSQKFERFISLIEDCSEEPKYKWNPNDVCLNVKNCFSPSFWGINGGSLFKPVECKCKKRFSFKCNSYYCASDHRACSELNQTKISSIQKC